MTTAEQGQTTDARVIRGLLLVALMLVFLGPALPASTPGTAGASPLGAGPGSAGPGSAGPLSISPGITVTPEDDAILVPSISLDAALVPIATEGQVLTPPSDTAQVGWWDLSAEPGARTGQTVMTGHTVNSGGGVMNELGALQPGDVVQVRDEGRLVDYRATRVQVYSKAELAAAAEELFAQDRGRGRLVLVTCTEFVDGDYLSNIVVVARPVRGAPTA